MAQKKGAFLTVLDTVVKYNNETYLLAHATRDFHTRKNHVFQQCTCVLYVANCVLVLLAWLRAIVVTSPLSVVNASSETSN